MGNERLVAVTDSGPIIHLTEIGCLSVLNIFDSLHVPDAVWAETVEYGRILPTDILRLSNLKRHSFPDDDITVFIKNYNIHELHSGECECLYLSKLLEIPILLTDDLAVREKAKSLNVIPVGSLGVIARACNLGKISITDAQSYITALYEVSSLFVTKAIVEIAIGNLKNPSKS